MRASAVALTRRGIAVGFDILSRNGGWRGKRHFSSLPRVDFSSIKDIHFARFLFREMMRVRPQPPVPEFNKLLGAVVKMEEYTTALFMFDEMRQSGGPIDAYSMSIAINCYCLVKRVDFGFAKLGCCFKLGYEPDAAIFTTLLKGLCLDDRVIEAEHLFSKLLAHNLCNEVMISTLVNGLCKGGFTARACDLLELLERTSCCKPNVYAYTTAIRSLCKDGVVEDALHLFHKMIDNGIMPTTATFNSIIPCLYKFCRWKDVIDLLHDKVIHKVSLDTFNFNVLVKALCMERKVNKARHVVEIMKRRNITDLFTYTMLMDGYCSQGRMVEAKGIFQSIVDGGLMPNLVSYTSLINGYCKKGMVDEAVCLFHEVPLKGLQHTTFSYNSMLNGLFSVGRFSEGWELYNDMEAQQVRPTLVTYNILLDGLIKQHGIESAFPFLKLMEDRGFHPDVFTYGTLVSGLCADGRVAAARDILYQLPSKGVQPDGRMYAEIIASLFQEGLVEEAKFLLKEMEGNGCTLTSVNYNFILHGLLKENKLCEVRPFLEEMRHKRFMADSSTVSLLVDQFQDHKENEILAQMIREVVPENMQTQLCFQK